MAGRVQTSRVDYLEPPRQKRVADKLRPFQHRRPNNYAIKPRNVGRELSRHADITWDAPRTRGDQERNEPTDSSALDRVAPEDYREPLPQRGAS